MTDSKVGVISRTYYIYELNEDLYPKYYFNYELSTGGAYSNRLSKDLMFESVATVIENNLIDTDFNYIVYSIEFDTISNSYEIKNIYRKEYMEDIKNEISDIDDYGLLKYHHVLQYSNL